MDVPTDTVLERMTLRSVDPVTGERQVEKSARECFCDVLQFVRQTVEFTPEKTHLIEVCEEINQVKLDQRFRCWNLSVYSDDRWWEGGFFFHQQLLHLTLVVSRDAGRLPNTLGLFCKKLTKAKVYSEAITTTNGFSVVKDEGNTLSRTRTKMHHQKHQTYKFQFKFLHRIIRCEYQQCVLYLLRYHLIYNPPPANEVKQRLQRRESSGDRGRSGGCSQIFLNTKTAQFKRNFLKTIRLRNSVGVQSISILCLKCSVVFN